MSVNLGRAAGIAAAAVAALVPSLVAAPAADATVTLAATFQMATWASPSAGQSNCSNVGTAGIRCDHVYGSEDLRTGIETCSEAGTRSIGVTTCHTTLTGYTTGSGRVVNERVAACVNTGVKTLTFAFGGASGSYPPFAVSASVDAGEGTFAGTSDPVLLPGVGLVIQSASGQFTMGCGPHDYGIGSFAGTWTLKRV